MNSSKKSDNSQLTSIEFNKNFVRYIQQVLCGLGCWYCSFDPHDCHSCLASIYPPYTGRRGKALKYLFDLYQKSDTTSDTTSNKTVSLYDFIKNWYLHQLDDIPVWELSFQAWWDRDGHLYRGKMEIGKLIRTDEPRTYTYQAGYNVSKDFRRDFKIPDELILPRQLEWYGEGGLHPRHFIAAVREWIPLIKSAPEGKIFV